MRVVLAGGGSAGHIEPALALADALRAADSSIEVICLGTQRGLETRLVPLRGYPLELIPAVPLPRSVTPKLLTVPGRLAGAIHTTGTILDRVGADVLVGFGGYVATPAYLAAERHKVPIVVHEANPYPGIANRLGAHLTTHVFTGYPETKLRNARYLGLPIRRQIAELDRFAVGDKARAHFGLRPDLPVLLVTGGSQGAKSLNRAVAGAAGAIRSAGVQILHVTGAKNTDEVQGDTGQAGGGPAPYVTVPYVRVPYVDRMDLAYAAADFALCRAGAMTCAELTADWLKTSLLPVLTNIDQVAGMSEAAAALGRRDADRWLAKAVIEIVAAERLGRPAAQPGRNQGLPSASAPGWPASPAPRDWPAPSTRPAPPAQPVRPAQPDRAAPSDRPAPPAQEPGSLFTPHSARQQPPDGQPRQYQAGPRSQAAPSRGDVQQRPS